MPLRRSPLFWTGLFIAVFLGWAWWDSHRYYTALTWIGRGIAWNADGKIGISLARQPGPDPFHFATTRMPYGSIWLPGIFAKFPTHAVAYRLLLPAFLFVWSTLLFHRWSRSRRPTAIPPDPAP